MAADDPPPDPAPPSTSPLSPPTPSTSSTSLPPLLSDTPSAPLLSDTPAPARPPDPLREPTLDPGAASVVPVVPVVPVDPVDPVDPVCALSPEMVAAAADLELATDAPAALPGAALPAGITAQDLAALARFARVRAFMARHGNKLWYLHSAYALTVGAFVVMYASKGYDNARWMVILLGLGWVVLIMFFRVFGTGAGQKERVKDTKSKVRFYVMTLALKNLYQSMLFFLVPFYYKTATFDAPNRFFVYLLILLAILSTVDVVFDQFLMRWKAPASAVYFFILFACLNLVLPALLPDTRTVLTQMSAAAIAAVVFFTMHVPLRNLLRPAWVLALIVSVAAAVFGTYLGRRAIPPVPMYISTGAVGPSLLPDGRLSMQVSALHESLIQEMHALTDVVIPGGRGNMLHHLWRREGLLVQIGEATPFGDPPTGTVRLRSTLRSFHLPPDLVGHWTIDVVTEDDQLVGRVPFEVIR